MAEAARPQMDLAGIAGGADLKVAPKAVDARLNQSKMFAEISSQGVIAVPAERLKEVKQSNGLARASIMCEISKGGIISAQIEPVAKTVDSGLAQALMLNEIGRQGVALKASETPDRSLNAEQLVALQAEAATEKKEISEAHEQHKGKLDLAGVSAGKELKKVDVEPKKDEGLIRGGFLNELSKQGAKVADVSKIPAKDVALTQASLLGAIKSQGVISVPEGSAPDKSLTDEQKSALLLDAKAEKKEDADNKDSHKAAFDLSGLKGVDLKHQEAPVVDHSATVARAGFLNELSKNI